MYSVEIWQTFGKLDTSKYFGNIISQYTTEIVLIPAVCRNLKRMWYCLSIEQVTPDTVLSILISDNDKFTLNKGRK